MGASFAALIVGFALLALLIGVIRLTNLMPDEWSGEAQDIPAQTHLDIYVDDETIRSDLSEQDTQEVETIVRIQLPPRHEYTRPVVGILDPLAYMQPCDVIGQRAPARVRLYPYCPRCNVLDGKPAPAYGLPRLCISCQKTQILPILPITGTERKHA